MIYEPGDLVLLEYFSRKQEPVLLIEKTKKNKLSSEEIWHVFHTLSYKTTYRNY